MTILSWAQKGHGRKEGTLRSCVPWRNTINVDQRAFFKMTKMIAKHRYSNNSMVFVLDFASKTNQWSGFQYYNIIQTLQGELLEKKKNSNRPLAWLAHRDWNLPAACDSAVIRLELFHWYFMWGLQNWQNVSCQRFCKANVTEHVQQSFPHSPILIASIQNVCDHTIIWPYA